MIHLEAASVLNHSIEDAASVLNYSTDIDIEEVKKILDILVRTKKRNLVLVGNSKSEAAVNELFRKTENKELGAEGPLKNVQVISIEKEFLYDKNQIPSKIKELPRILHSLRRYQGFSERVWRGVLNFLIFFAGHVAQSSTGGIELTKMPFIK
ncbi:Clp R domain-containing protein [Forsythia ovata]|uniref:Clp R domain-containing protein n=1 Tax=Forsythia ovata TaxID=205694 RepID=A0ABD1UTS1_9LAMI